MRRRAAPMIANVRRALDDRASPITAAVAWYIAAVIALVLLLIGIGWSQ